jgi:hypothetical protein
MLCPHCIYMFCIYLRTNSNLCCLHHKLIGFYNRVENCLQCGTDWVFNPLNAELNPICHLLVLLGDLTFMGPCIASIFQYISNKMQRYTVYLYLETALHASGGTSNHHQERIQLYLQYATHSTLKPVPTLPR